MKRRVLEDRLASDDVAGRTRARRSSLTRRRDIQDGVYSRRNDLQPRLQLKDVALPRLAPAKRRLHRPDEAHVQEIVKSLEVFGYARPILISSDFTVVDGHDVVEAARRLGFKHLPCIVIDHLGEDELRLLAVTLNRIAENAMWDAPTLAVELQELECLGLSLDVTGFDATELDLILVEDGAEVLESGSVEPDLAVPPVSQIGDVWLMGAHRLLNGDALEPMSFQVLMGEARARLCLTDMPFNVPIRGHVTGKAHAEFAMASGEMSAQEYAGFIRQWMRNALASLVDGGLLATFIDWRGLGETLGAGAELGLSQLNLIVWNKANAGMGALWRSKHELLPVFKMGSAAHVNNVQLGKSGRWRSNVWDYPGASSLSSDAREGLSVHPTVKPREMLADAIMDVTKRGDIVLDPFIGSGSTILAAEITRRRAFGIEIDPRYVDVAIRRWQSQTGKDAVLEETRETFADVARRRAGITACDPAACDPSGCDTADCDPGAGNRLAVELPVGNGPVEDRPVGGKSVGTVPGRRKSGAEDRP